MCKIYWIFFFYESVWVSVLFVSRWPVECLHFGWSWQQSGCGPGTKLLTLVQSEPFVTACAGQSDRWTRLAQPLPTSHHLL